MALNYSKLARKVRTSMGRSVTFGKARGARTSKACLEMAACSAAAASVAACVLQTWGALSLTRGREPDTVVSSAEMIRSPRLEKTVERSTSTG